MRSPVHGRGGGLEDDEQGPDRRHRALGFQHRLTVEPHHRFGVAVDLRGGLERSVSRNRRRGVPGEAGAVRPKRDPAGGVGREPRSRPPESEGAARARACFPATGGFGLVALRLRGERFLERRGRLLQFGAGPFARRGFAKRAGVVRHRVLLDPVEKRDPLGQHTRPEVRAASPRRPAWASRRRPCLRHSQAATR